MRLDRLFFSVNQKFFNIFDELAILIRKMSALFHTLPGGGKQAARHLAEMEELERSCAKQVHNLFMELGRSLITPFDREDIHFLATDLSSIGRNLLHITKQIKNLDIDCNDGITLIIAKRCDDAIGMLAQMLNKFKNVGELTLLKGICADIGKILHDCDDQLDEVVTMLLKEEKDEFRLIKMIDHYEAMQKLIGKIDDMTNVCESIIIKYS